MNPEKYGRLDFHAHILPGMDDGSRSVGMSVSMLNAMREQGIRAVAATPHFHADDGDVPSFLERRAASLSLLGQAYREEFPVLLPGAEVSYYEGISRLDGLFELCIAGSGLLLLEMPFSRWSDYAVRELTELSGSCGMTVVLAHIERYPPLRKRTLREKLLQNGVLMQLNAETLLSFRSRRRALTLLRDGSAALIGSDCHNDTTRAPDAGKAYDYIEKRLGRSFSEELLAFGQSLLSGE